MFKNIIIAGSEKCGTTSLFSYLIQSKLFDNSYVKETNYFRGDSCNKVDYSKFFKNDGRIRLEASPGYLTCSKTSALNIEETLGNEVLLIFILRDPVKRFVSSYNFHRSKGNITVELADYFYNCQDYYQKGIYENDENFDWFNDVLGAGVYSERLKPFDDYFISDNMMFIDFELLKSSPEIVLNSIFERLNLDASYIDKVDFKPKNVTVRPRFKYIHMFLIKINYRLEKFWQNHQGLKEFLLCIYRFFNDVNSESKLDSESTQRIIDFYSEERLKLHRKFNR